MKKKQHLWPSEIVEIPAPSSRDPRSDDPQATQKITRDQLEQALKRTKSGFRRAVRESRPEIDPVSDSRVEPAEEQPVVEIPDPVITVKDDDVPIGTPIPRSRSASHVVTPSTAVVPAPVPEPPFGSSARTRILLALVVALLTTAALAIGYVAGRGSFH